MSTAQDRMPGWAWGAIAAAFFIGRCSVDEPKQVQPSASAPAAFAANPTPSTAETSDVDAQVDTLDSDADATVSEPAPTESAEAVDVVPARYEAPVYYRNCSEARAAGAAPVYASDPGYAPHLDRDHDGIGCE